MTASDSLIGAIDIGGTKLAVGAVSRDGRPVAWRRAPTRHELGPEALCEQMAEMLESCQEEAGAPLTGVGIGCGGPLDRKHGSVFTIPNMPGWDGFPLTAFFDRRLGLPITLDNDANAAALGEALFGAGRGASHVCYFTVSTGIGGGIVVEERLYRGANDLSGEFGHQVIVPDGPRCPCGGWGCLEALASGTSIARRARERLSTGVRSIVLEWCAGNPILVTAEMLARAAGAGDEMALQIWAETATYLGLGVLNVIHLFNPSVVVLGGGVLASAGLLLPAIHRTVTERGMGPLVDSCKIVAATLGDRVGLVGAAALALEAGF